MTIYKEKGFGVFVEYGYCSHCGAEYNYENLPYIRTTASGDLLRCLDCGAEVHSFTVPSDE